MNIVDYLIAHSETPPPRSGIAYDYVLAGNGILLSTENDHLELCLEVTSADIRGLPKIVPFVRLRHGRIPNWVWWEAIDQLHNGLFAALHFSADGEEPQGLSVEEESLVYITWDERDGYSVRRPQQDVTPAQVAWVDEDKGDVVVEIHSHHQMRAYFSRTDDRDERGTALYGVVGRLNTPEPQVTLRVGAYDVHNSVDWNEIFDGTMSPFQEVDSVTESTRAWRDSVIDSSYTDRPLENLRSAAIANLMRRLTGLRR